MAGYFEGKVVYIIGPGSDAHRAVAVSLAQSGADIAIGGKGGMPDEVPLHSISNEIWAIGRRSIVVPIEEGNVSSFAEAVGRVTSELGHTDLVLRCEDVGSA